MSKSIPQWMPATRGITIIFGINGRIPKFPLLFENEGY